MFKAVLTVVCLSICSIAGAETAIFAGGCFWCMQSDFDKLPGVTKTEAGYDGGKVKKPTYELVSTGKSGYSEAVKVTYNPKIVSYSQLLEYYWHHIDPVNPNGQFCDIGEEYQSKIFYLTPEQKQEAQTSLVKVKQLLGSAVYTAIVPSTNFTKAEEYHQDYYKKNPVKYEFYRWNCGRDKRVREVWQHAAN